METEEHKQFMRKFHDVCYEKYLFRHIKSLVNTALDTYQDDLDRKRNRLKELMEGEEKEYETEYRVMVENRLQNTIRERQESLLKIRNQKLLEEEEFIKEKRAEQIIKNSDTIRTMLSKNFLVETKRCQLAQIEEAKRRREEEIREHCAWLKVQKEMDERKAKFEEIEKNLRHQYAKCNEEYILKQHAERIKPIDEYINGTSEYVNGTGNLFRDADRVETEKEQRAARLRKQNQQDNIILAKMRDDFNRNQKCEEDRFVDALNKQAVLEIQKAKEEKPDYHKEGQAYRQYLEQTKQDKLKCKQMEDAEIEKLQKLSECQMLTKYNEFKENRFRNAKETHKGLLEQLRAHDQEKFNRTVMDNEQFLALKQLWERDNQKEMDKQKARRQHNKDVQQEIIGQALARNQRNCDEVCRNNEANRKVMEYSDHLEKLALSITKEDDKFLMNHPNWILASCGCKNPP